MKDYIIHIFFLTALLLGGQTASAIEVNADHGGMLDKLISTPESEKSLYVHGKVDASDLMFIAGKMTGLLTLDLSDATIEACVTVVNGRTRQFAAGIIPQDIFAGTSIKKFIFPQKCKIEIADMAFVGSELTDITLGDNITKVGVGAFCASNSLTTLEYSGATVICPYAFRDCKSLERVTIEDVDTIGQYVFAGCENLTQIIGSEALTNIEESAFAGCLALTGFNFGRQLISIADGAFSSSALVEADLSDCTGLKSLGAWAFSNCDGLKTVLLPEGLEHIGEGAFFDCSALTSFRLPESAELIAAYSLKGASSVTELAIPTATKYIGDMAMCGMTALKSIDARLAKSVPGLGDNVWDGLAKDFIALHVSRDLADAYRSAPQWKDFNIVMTSSADTAISPGLASKIIYADINGSNLSVRSDDNIRELHIYDISARKIYSDTSLNRKEATVDIEPFGDRILIICATTDGGIRAILKIVRY